MPVFVNPAEYLFENTLHHGYVIAHQLPDIDQLQSTKFPDTILRSKQTYFILLL